MREHPVALIVLIITAVCLLLVIWLLQAPIRDIPYLMSPEVTYVRQISYDVDSDESSDYYYVEASAQRETRCVLM